MDGIKLVISHRLFKNDYHYAGKISRKKKLCMKICRRGHKTQKKCVKIRVKEVIFTVCVQKPEFCASCGKFCVDVFVCLPLLETLIFHTACIFEFHYSTNCDGHRPRSCPTGQSAWTSVMTEGCINIVLEIKFFHIVRNSEYQL